MFESPVLNSVQTPDQPPPPKRVSAGVAFLLSLLLPGGGQLYCGKTARAFYIMGFWIGGILLIALFNDSEQALGVGFSLVTCLYLFAFLDAYFTAREVNSGLDAIVDENPRAAAVLNLLTWGLGYFYLGERTKGLVLFFAGRFLGNVLSNLSGWAILLVIGVQVGLAWDAHRIGKAEIQRRLGTLLPGEELRPESSRLPAAVPIGLALLMILGLTAMAIFGAAVSRNG